ncbi:hypothetical protein INR49_010675 [Caranx melampygus]|nr:hypothetical protein INR49_010675 [Caranx melampygus]
MSVLQEISSNVRNIKQLEYAVLARRAQQIKEELRQGVRKPYKDIIDVSWGDPHRVGVKPLSFVRQVLAACIYPQLLNSNRLPADVRQRAQRLLGCAGGSVVPCHCTTSQSIMSLGAVVVPYYLSEEQGWEMQIEEVYQDCVYGEKSEFISYKKVLMEMGPPLSDTVELASFHSASKGYMGECGLRGGYVELVNVDSDIMTYIHTLFSTDTCAPTLGQFALELMINPPQPGDPSYLLYEEETQHARTTLAHNMKKACEVVNRLVGFYCQPVEGGAFAFPRVHLPPKATQKAKEVGMEPDTFYCMRLLEETGLLVSPGSEYGQKEGTYHIRYKSLF